MENKFGKQVTDIVRQVTDDRSLPKEEKKRLQIVHAPHRTHEAKLVKLADKLYNLRDLTSQIPVDWPQERVDEHLIWAWKVVQFRVYRKPVPQLKIC